MRLGIPAIDSADDYQRHFHDDVWRQAAAVICERHRLSYKSLRRSIHGENIIFFVDGAFIIKIYTPFREGFLREKAALEFADGKLGIETPAIVKTGELEGLSYIVMTQLSGLPLRDVWAGIEERGRIEIVSRLGIALSKLHAHAAPLSETALNRDWNGFIRRQAHTSVKRQRACDANPEWLESLPAYITARLGLLPIQFEPVMLHGDVHPGNVLLTETGGRWQVTGLFDFADSLCGFHEYEFVAPGVLMVQGNRELQRVFLLAYGYEEAQLDLNMRARLMLLTVLYECSDLRKYALRLAPAAVHLTLDELEAAIWTFAKG
ncbi:MAG TPA: aminoglycoside phosphotransferase family protein [Pyrinomonadaceae bacterium]|jgi:hygromycin-B 7''-O-kinase